MNPPPTHGFVHGPDPLTGSTPDGPEHPAWIAALAALRERIERLEADVRHLQSQLANRA